MQAQKEFKKKKNACAIWTYADEWEEGMVSNESPIQKHPPIWALDFFMFIAFYIPHLLHKNNRLTQS